VSGDASSLPTLLNVRTVQEAWVEAVQALRAAKWELRTLTVHITEPLSMDNAVHGTICAFARSHGLPHPRWVARTIFPQSLYQRFGRGFYDKYNGPGGFYESIPSRHRRWGTYFRRLTHYETTGGPVNQLQNITTGINSSGDVLRAAYTAVLPIPGAETVKRLGGPCLHYLAFQLVPTTLSLPRFSGHQGLGSM
jgi:hypothetical protein